MREIKFRAWDRRHKEMILIDDFYWFEENEVHSQDEASGTTGDFFLMQFTGLKDKNGTDLYEGDIVRGLVTDEVGEVLFSTKRCSFCVLVPSKYKTYSLGAEVSNKFEIIGNIYENPELLK